MTETEQIVNSQIQQAFPTIEQEDGETGVYSIKENIIVQQPGEKIQTRKGLGLSGTNVPSNVYGIFLNYDVLGNDDLMHVQIKIPQQFNVSDTVEYAIDTFNEKFKKENIQYKLTKEHHYWNLHIAKKSGKPKSDYPALDIDSKIQDCGKLNFSLHPKNVNNCIFNLEENNYVSSNDNLTQQETNMTDASLQNSISGDQQQISQSNNNNSSLQGQRKAYEGSLLKSKNKKRKEKPDNQGGCFSCF